MENYHMAVNGFVNLCLIQFLLKMKITDNVLVKEEMLLLFSIWFYIQNYTHIPEIIIIDTSK